MYRHIYVHIAYKDTYTFTDMCNGLSKISYIVNRLQLQLLPIKWGQWCFISKVILNSILPARLIQLLNSRLNTGLYGPRFPVICANNKASPFQCRDFYFDELPLVYICFCCLCFWCHIREITAKINVMKLSPLCILLEFLQFQVFRLSL